MQGYATYSLTLASTRAHLAIVDGQPLGTGVAAQKSVAKEEAARQALQVRDIVFLLLKNS